MSARVILIFLCACLSPALARGAEDAGAGFANANRLYDQGHFREAATAYEELVKAGFKTPTILFNLGNAWFKSGEIGRAVAAYRRAERSAPRDPDIRANLQFARNQVQGPTLKTGRTRQWFGRLTLNEWTVLAAAGVWVSLLMAAAMQWRPDYKRSLRTPLIASAVVSVVLAGCLGTAYAQAKETRLGVVVVPEATVRQGPLDEAATLFVLHDGAELEVMDRKDDWVQVSTDPRRMGWLRQTNIMELSPPLEPGAASDGR